MSARSPLKSQWHEGTRGKRIVLPQFIALPLFALFAEFLFFCKAEFPQLFQLLHRYLEAVTRENVGGHIKSKAFLFISSVCSVILGDNQCGSKHLPMKSEIKGQ